ncbi:hypothetical protein [Brunnivagina elsteri]|nr:hypothetical protein [Calothrix elsteri]
MVDILPAVNGGEDVNPSSGRNALLVTNNGHRTLHLLRMHLRFPFVPLK